jgi:hypothetical protein
MSESFLAYRQQIALFKKCLKSTPFWDFSYETGFETLCFLAGAEIKDLTALILVVWAVSKRGVFETINSINFGYSEIS